MPQPSSSRSYPLPVQTFRGGLPSNTQSSQLVMASAISHARGFRHPIRPDSGSGSMGLGIRSTGGQSRYPGRRTCCIGTSILPRRTEPATFSYALGIADGTSIACDDIALEPPSLAVLQKCEHSEQRSPVANKAQTHEDLVRRYARHQHEHRCNNYCHEILGLHFG